MAKRIYNQTSLFGPLYAYLVVLSPPAAIKEAIARIKVEMNSIADILPRNVNSIAHITLTDKLTDEPELFNTVGELTAGHPPFMVTVDGWGVFDHGKNVTLYLRVLNPEPVNGLAELLKSSARTPHISLAKKISHETLDRLGPYLNDLDYTAQWECTEIVVLRKLMSEKHLGWKDSFRVPLKGNSGS